MSPFEQGRRLCLLVEAGAGRFAVEATSVLEVTAPDPSGESVRGTWPLVDLLQLLGGPPEERPGMAVVLDSSPTLALRVKKVREVADVAASPLSKLPSQVGLEATPWARGCLWHRDELYLELIAEVLPHHVRQAGGIRPAAARPVYPWEQPPQRALVVESSGQLYGFALGWVSQVVQRSNGALPLWTQEISPGLAGMDWHLQSLWPVYSLPGLLGGQASLEPFLILTEPAGQALAFTAQSVLGVFEGFCAQTARGSFTCKALPSPALFLDLPHMFS